MISDPRLGRPIKGWIELMPGTTFLVTLAALVAAKCAARIAVDSGHFDGLPRPSQLD
jgi:hypothetical protein